MKRIKSIRMADIAAGVLTLAAVGFGSMQLLTKDTATDVCAAAGQKHRVVISDDAFSKTEMTLKQCDSLTIVNQDTRPHQIAFGERASHASYPGFKSLIVRQDESITLDAVQPGQYELHDHLRDNARLQLTIQPARN